MSNDDVMIRILSKLDKMYGQQINLPRVRKSLEEILSDYNIIQRTNEIMVINNMRNMIDYYLIVKKTEGSSNNTIKTYNGILTAFSNHVMKDISDITEIDIRLYLANYSKTGVKNSTIATTTDILRGFFTWLFDAEYITKRNPMKLIRTIKTEKYIKDILTKEELEILKNSCTDLRSKCLVCVLYSSGCRVSEVSNMKISNIDFIKSQMKIYGEKSKQERIVYLDAPAIVSIKNYLNSRKDDYDALFLTKRSPYKNMEKRAIEKEIKKIAKQSGIKKNVFCHLMRSTLATNLSASGVPITSIKSILGHASISTTMIYTQISDKNVEQDFRRAM